MILINDILIQRKTTSSPKQNGIINGELSTPKVSSTNTESKGKENKEQNHCQDDSDEHADNSEKKKKGEMCAFYSDKISKLLVSINKEILMCNFIYRFYSK